MYNTAALLLDAVRIMSVALLRGDDKPIAKVGQKKPGTRPGESGGNRQEQKSPKLAD
jgi:hypothetical protein